MCVIYVLLGLRTGSLPPADLYHHIVENFLTEWWAGYTPDAKYSLRTHVLCVWCLVLCISKGVYKQWMVLWSHLDHILYNSSYCRRVLDCSSIFPSCTIGPTARIMSFQWEGSLRPCSVLIFAASLPKRAFNSSLLTEATYLYSVSSTISKVASYSPCIYEY